MEVHKMRGPCYIEVDSHVPKPKVNERIILLFVLGVWAALSVAGLLLIARYGHSIPKRDDWTGLAFVGFSDLSIGGVMQQAVERRTVTLLPRASAWYLAPDELPVAMLAGFAISSAECSVDVRWQEELSSVGSHQGKRVA